LFSPIYKFRGWQHDAITFGETKNAEARLNQQKIKTMATKKKAAKKPAAKKPAAKKKK
jgi:hypothetical protein